MTDTQRVLVVVRTRRQGFSSYSANVRGRVHNSTASKVCADANHARAYVRKVIANSDGSVQKITVWLTATEYAVWVPGRGWKTGVK